MSDESEGVADGGVGVEGEDVAVEDGGFVFDGVGVVFFGEDLGDVKVVASAVDDCVDVVEDGAVGEGDLFGAGDALDCGDGGGEAAFHEGEELCCYDWSSNCDRWCGRKCPFFWLVWKCFL